MVTARDTISVGIFVVKIFCGLLTISFLKFEGKNFCAWNFRTSVDHITTQTL